MERREVILMTLAEVAAALGRCDGARLKYIEYDVIRDRVMFAFDGGQAGMVPFQGHAMFMPWCEEFEGGKPTREGVWLARSMPH